MQNICIAYLLRQHAKKQCHFLVAIGSCNVALYSYIPKLVYCHEENTGITHIYTMNKLLWNHQRGSRSTVEVCAGLQGMSAKLLGNVHSITANMSKHRGKCMRNWSFIWGMIHSKIHLINPVCPLPSLAIQRRNVAYSTIHTFILKPSLAHAWNGCDIQQVMLS